MRIVLTYVSVFLTVLVFNLSCTKEKRDNISKYDPNKHDFVGVLLEHRSMLGPWDNPPIFMLYDSTFQHTYFLIGNISIEDCELIIGISGRIVGLDSISVSSYDLLSRIRYHKFLVQKAGEYTAKNYPCLSSIRPKTNEYITNWDKSFGWGFESKDFTPILKVRMTDTYSTDTIKQYYELWYNGITGNFLKEIRFPDIDFCNSNSANKKYSACRN